MPARRSIALLLTSLLGVACGPAPTATTTPSPGTTIATSELHQAWESALAPTSGQLAELRAVLGAHGTVMLRPTTPLTGATVVSGDLGVAITAPDGRPTVDLTVRGADLAVVVSVSTTTIATQPPCQDRVDGGWVPVVVRTIAGCGLLVPGAVSSVDWVEHDQWFHAEFDDGRDADAVILWLGEWVEV